MNVGGECHLNEHCILQTQKVSCVVAKSTLLFTDHIPRSQNCMKMQFCETCKYCIAKRVTVNGVNSNKSTESGGNC